MRIAIIGGSGFYGDLKLFDGEPKETKNYRAKSLEESEGKKYTFLGKLFWKIGRALLYSREWKEKEDRFTVPLMQEGTVAGKEVIFVSRHGPSHLRLAHEVRYRAILAALKEKKVDAIITTSAVGGINPGYGLGDFVVPSDAGELFPARKNWVYSPSHYAVSPLYDGGLRGKIVEAGKSLGLTIHDGGNYALKRGPEFETAKEVDDLSRLGYDMVSMTTATEAKMAKQIGIPLATVCLVTNAAQKSGSHQVSDAEVQEMMKKKGADFVRLLRKTVELI